MMTLHALALALSLPAFIPTWARHDPTVSFYRLIEAPLTDAKGRNTVAFTRATTAYCPQADGTYLSAAINTPCATAMGTNIAGATTNYFVNSLDAGAWSKIGTPLISANSTCGPFCVVNGGNEADTVDDPDGAVNGFFGDASAPGVGSWTFSCFLKRGTSTTVRLRIATDGTGAAISDPFTPAETWTRYSLVTTVGGTPTYVRWLFYPADSAGAGIGSVIMSGCQFEKLAYASRPCLAGGVAAVCNGDVVTSTTTGWPTSKGRVTFYYTPGGDFGTMINSRNPGVSGWSLGLSNSTNIFWYSKSVAGAGTNKLISSTAFVSGTRYFMDMRWQADGGAQIYRNGSLLGGATGCDPADVLGATGYLGSYSTTGQLNGEIADVRIQ